MKNATFSMYHIKKGDPKTLSVSFTLSNVLFIIDVLFNNEIDKILMPLSEITEPEELKKFLDNILQEGVTDVSIFVQSRAANLTENEQYLIARIALFLTINCGGIIQEEIELTDQEPYTPIDVDLLISNETISQLNDPKFHNAFNEIQ